MPLETLAMFKVMFGGCKWGQSVCGGLLSFHGQRPKKRLDSLYSTGQQCMSGLKCQSSRCRQNP